MDEKVVLQSHIKLLLIKEKVVMREWYFAKNGYLASFSELRINKFFKAKKIRDNLVFDSDKKEKKL